MTSDTRRYDIDWLRVVAIGLLLIYHIAIVFQPWGVFIGFIQSDRSLESLWIPMSMLNVWRIPLLFFVSGMGVGFASRKRNLKQLIIERTRRIFVPFIFGLFFIVPIHLLIWQKYYHQEMVYSPGPGHLWFLANIFLYVILLSPLLINLKNRENGKARKFINRVFSHPAGLVLITLCFMAEAEILNPETFAAYALSLHGFILGFLAFFFGYMCIISGEQFWLNVEKLRWFTVIFAIILFIIRYTVFDLNAPYFMMAIESCSWIFSLLGFGYRYLNHPGPMLSYLSQGAYPVYILHMIFLYLGSFFILPMQIPIFFKFLLLLVFTLGGCILVYELVVRRLNLLRPLFGLKTVISQNSINQNKLQKNEKQ